MDEDDFLIVVNASNREKLLGHFEAVRSAADLAVKIDDQTLFYGDGRSPGPKVIP
jgi:glycine cleavage system aminomethyltransferase T